VFGLHYRYRWLYPIKHVLQSIGKKRKVYDVKGNCVEEKKDAGIPWQDRQSHEHGIKKGGGHYENRNFCVPLEYLYQYRQNGRK
jgi:hypothetical protein